MLRQTGDVVDGRYVTVEEQVAIFLGILAHHKNVRVVKFDHWRSGYTVSKYVHAVLRVVPESVAEDCEDHRWQWFKVDFFFQMINTVGSKVFHMFALGRGAWEPLMART